MKDMKIIDGLIGEMRGRMYIAPPWIGDTLRKWFIEVRRNEGLDLSSCIDNAELSFSQKMGQIRAFFDLNNEWHNARTNPPDDNRDVLVVLNLDERPIFKGYYQHGGWWILPPDVKAEGGHDVLEWREI